MVHVGGAQISQNIISVYCSQVIAQLIPADISLSLCRAINGYYCSNFARFWMLDVNTRGWGSIQLSLLLEVDTLSHFLFFAEMCLPTVDRHVSTWTRYRASSWARSTYLRMFQCLPNQAMRQSQSEILKNKVGGFTLRCKESCHRSIFWAAGWAWWSSGNLQSSSSWRWCQAAK